MAYIVGVIGADSMLGVRSLEAAADELWFVSGSMRASADDARIATVILETQDGTKTVELKVKITDARFAEYNIKGKLRGEEKRSPQEIL